MPADRLAKKVFLSNLASETLHEYLFGNWFMVSKPRQPLKIDPHIRFPNRAIRITAGDEKAVRFPKDILLSNASLGPFDEDFAKENATLLLHFEQLPNEFVTGVVCSLNHGKVSNYHQSLVNIHLCHTQNEHATLSIFLQKDTNYAFEVEGERYAET